MLMASGLKESVQIVGYVQPNLKQRAERLKDRDRRMTVSRLIEEALADYLPKVEQRMDTAHPTGQSRKSPR